jgi:hypothetical protein
MIAQRPQATQVSRWSVCEAIQEPDIQRSWAPTTMPTGGYSGEDRYLSKADSEINAAPAVMGRRQPLPICVVVDLDQSRGAG